MLSKRMKMFRGGSVPSLEAPPARIPIGEFIDLGRTDQDGKQMFDFRMFNLESDFKYLGYLNLIDILLDPKNIF